MKMIKAYLCSFRLVLVSIWLVCYIWKHCLHLGPCENYPISWPGAVVRAVSLSHQVAGSKQPLRRFCGGKACLGFSLPQTPLMWEPPALGVPFFF